MSQVQISAGLVKELRDLTGAGMMAAKRALEETLERAPGADRAWPPAWMMATGAVLGVGAHLLNALPDLADDDATGVRGLPQRLGAGRVRVLDLKAYYTGTPVDVVPDPELYRAVVELFPDAVLEDASLDGECGVVLRGQEGRMSFDAPIHSVADVRALLVEPGWMNIKPSRFGTIERLLECIEHCAAGGIQMYGGGQFELGPGRRQIQRLASVFYADGPNDVAPSEYNEGPARPGLPQSPLPPPEGAGF